ncbi:hypothetical protein [Prosthecobacter sp.]|uniref:hypothetical protein n=1 Tax=Prosthecobacter sp. TaxID=1965333 RepID=UPI0037842E12
MKTKHHHSMRQNTTHPAGRRRVLAKRARGAGRRKLRAPVRPHAPVPAPAREARPLPAPAASLQVVRSTASEEDVSCLIMSVEVPVSFTAAYDAWVRSELPYFMLGTQAQDPYNPSRMTWRVHTLFEQFAWQAQVCEVTPYEHIAWDNAPGMPHPNFGSVSFEPIDSHRTWVIVQIGFDMSGIYRWLGDPLPSISQSLERALLRFHDFASVSTLNAAELLPAS